MGFLFWKKSADEWLENLARRYGTYRRDRNAYGMTTDNELQFLETYAREQFKGHGRLVDLGCWFGATTVSLARGLASNRQATAHRTVDAIDLFRWEAWMDPFVPQVSLPHQYTLGQSFYEDVKGLLSVHGDLVNVEQHNLLEYHPPPIPIEFLFIDAMKDWALAQTIVSRFFPLLIADESYVVQQDFAYYYPEMATNHLIMWYLRDHFRFVHHVPSSCSVVFLFTKPLAPSALPVFEPGLFTPDMVEDAYQYSLACVSPDMRARVEVAKLNFLIEQDYRQSGRRQMERLARSPDRLDEPMLNEVRRVGAKAAAGKAPAAEWQAEIEDWVASMLRRLGGAR